jgi:hypothetical protein
MICVYDDMACTGVDTSGMDKIPCEDCPHFHNGVRKTGAMPGLEWFYNQIKKLWTRDSH